MANASYVVTVPVVKVSVGEADGNRVARILREGAPVPEGVAQEQLTALAKRKLIRKVTAREVAAAKRAEKSPDSDGDKAGAGSDAGAQGDDQGAGDGGSGTGD